MAAVQFSGDRLRTIALGTMVVILYATFVSAVFAGFASYIYRSEWQAAISADSKITDLENLFYIIRQEEGLLRAIAEDRAEMSHLDAEVKKHQAQNEQATVKVVGLEEERKKQAFHELAKLRNLMTDLPFDAQQQLDDIMSDGKMAVTDRADRALPVLRIAAETSGAEPKQLILSAVTEMEASRQNLLAQEQQYLADIQAARGDLDQAELKFFQRKQGAEDRAEQLAAIRENLPPASPDRARFAALATKLPVVGNMFQHLVSYPTIFLTLIVTIASGGLGTIVSFSRKYYSKKEKPSMARLFVNVGEGIAAAIAIFLFSGAGMLALTQGSGSGSAVELSPYTVAFVAFLSGFMAEEAFEAIQRAGARLFQGNGQ